MKPKTSYKFIDIGANLLDSMFQGKYFGKNRHQGDLDLVMKRALENHIDSIIVTSSNLHETKSNLELIKKYNDPRFSNRSTPWLFTTIGVHPTNSGQFLKQKTIPAARGHDSTKPPIKQLSPEEYMQQLVDLGLEGKKNGSIVALGEFGLDYDRLNWSPKRVQLEFFEKQLQVLASKVELPLFLHNRSCGFDLINLLKKYPKSWKKGGVVHSFTGTVEELKAFLDLGFYIGVNGCSMKTEANCKVVKEIPLDRLLIETDAPWCTIKATSFANKYIKTRFETCRDSKFKIGQMVKNRAEPSHMIQVFEAICGIHGFQTDEQYSKLNTTLFDSALSLFFPGRLFPTQTTSEKVFTMIETKEPSESIEFPSEPTHTMTS